MLIAYRSGRAWLRSVLLRPIGQRGGRSAASQLTQAGMTLIEILIVVALLGTLMAYLVRELMGTAENAKIDQTKLGMNVVQQGLQMYRVHNNRYPTTDQGLDALLTQPGDSKSWRGPYSESNKLQDPWGTKFNYESDGRTFKITSAGGNQAFGDSDDITYPDEAEGGQGASGN